MAYDRLEIVYDIVELAYDRLEIVYDKVEMAYDRGEMLYDKVEMGYEPLLSLISWGPAPEAIKRPALPLNKAIGDINKVRLSLVLT